ncbi:MAG TPA: DPP IV N-terminal domain-containing protein, partial [Pyrinomonadaceae bacterium]|nr:DPP IV N-terminal domain-containing protein [Pyrinomonadaceae bacterium]
EDGEWLIPAEKGEGPDTAVMSGEASTRHWPTTTSDSPGPQSMSSAEYLIRGISKNKSVAVIAAAVFVAILFGIGFAIYKYRNGTDNTLRSIKIDKLTTDGKTVSAAISPDGKHAIYSVDEGGAQSMWNKQIATSSNVPIIPPAEGVEYGGIQFTPEGNFVTFLKRDKTSSLYMLYQMPAFGGTQKKLATDVDGAVSYSPDGKQFSFIRGNSPEMGESTVMIANADGTGERVLAKRKRPETFPWWRTLGNVAWAPDGKTIAVVIGGPTTGSGLMDVAELNVDDGSLKPITKKGWYEIRQILWLPDKSGLLVMGAEKASDYFRQQIWYLSYPDGEARRINPDFNNYIGMSVTADGKSLAAIQSNRISNIWVVPNADASRAVQIKAGGANQEGTDGIAWVPDGRIVFYSTASGGDDLWIVNNDGTGVKQLTSDAGTNYDPVITPDGRYVVFVSERAGQPNIWRMNLDGSDARQLTFGKTETNVSITPDSKWIFFDSTDVGFPCIWKISIDGGEPTQVTTRYTEDAEVSRDGKLFTSQFRENATASWRQALFSIDGGEPLKVFDLPGGDISFRWSPDGRSLTQELTTKGVTNVWSYPLDGGQPKQLTNFKNDQIFNFRWSPDGKSLVLARGTVMADLVMIRDFK